MNNKTKKAMDYFSEGYNCSQSVVLAFSDILHNEGSEGEAFSDEMLLRLASSFGGGIGRLREVCGAVSGMAIVAGLLFGYSSPEASDEKKAHYEKIQLLAKRFEAENGSIVCRELLGLDKGHDIPTPERRTAEYYKKRPCRELVGSAARILSDFLKENSVL